MGATTSKPMASPEEEGLPPTGPGVDMEPPKSPHQPGPGLEVLTAKLKASEATVEQLRTSLEQMEGGYNKLQEKYNRIKRLFRNELEGMRMTRTMMEEELEWLLHEEGQLFAYHRQVLKENLLEASRSGWRKLDKIRKLTRRLDSLKNGKGRMKLAAAAEASRTAGQSEGEIASAILPEEVWQAIFEKHLSDPKDLWSLCNTCQLFDNILAKWKTGWLFGQALPYIYKDLPSEKLLESRLVCKGWKSAVDKFLENHENDKSDPRRLDFVNPMKEKGLKSSIPTFHFCNHEDPSILEDPYVPMTTLPGWNPFVGRYIRLDLGAYEPSEDNMDRDMEQLLEKVSSFLGVLGEQIWYLSLGLPRDPPFQPQHPRIIHFLSHDLWLLLPNLRELDMPPINVSESHVGNLTESFPSHSNLETIKFSAGFSFEEPVIAAMMTKYCGQLKKLFTFGGPTSFPDFLNCEWPILKELHLTYIIDQECLRRLIRVRIPQLSKLGLKLEEVINDTRFEELVSIINALCFTTCLDTIRLDGGLQFMTIEYDPQLSDNPICSSLIKTVEIHHDCEAQHDYDWEAPETPDYTFLLKHFPFIENLHLYVKDTNDKYEIDLLPQPKCLEMAEKEGFQEMFEIVEVNKYAYRGQMYKSNIWELLRNLEVFTFQWDVYSRGGYEAYQEKRKENE